MEYHVIQCPVPNSLDEAWALVEANNGSWQVILKIYITQRNPEANRNAMTSPQKMGGGIPFYYFEEPTSPHS
jgi:hypothetical protein